MPEAQRNGKGGWRGRGEEGGRWRSKALGVSKMEEMVEGGIHIYGNGYPGECLRDNI